MNQVNNKAFDDLIQIVLSYQLKNMLDGKKLYYFI